MTQLPINAFIQYGAIGLTALVFIITTVALYRWLEKAYQQEVARADRLEQELLALNKLITEQLAGELVHATEAIRDVVELLRSRRRW